MYVWPGLHPRPRALVADVLPRLLQARHAQGELVQVAVQKQSLPVVIVLHHGVAAEQPVRTFDARGSSGVIDGGHLGVDRGPGCRNEVFVASAHGARDELEVETFLQVEERPQQQRLPSNALDKHRLPGLVGLPAEALHRRLPKHSSHGRQLARADHPVVRPEERAVRSQLRVGEDELDVAHGHVVGVHHEHLCEGGEDASKHLESESANATGQRVGESRQNLVEVAYGHSQTIQVRHQGLMRLLVVYDPQFCREGAVAGAQCVDGHPALRQEPPTPNNHDSAAFKHVPMSLLNRSTTHKALPLLPGLFPFCRGEVLGVEERSRSSNSLTLRGMDKRRGYF
mmetsp:Transcript_2140/g.4351  ORF Transcript_2140/g.4351 Transcript_2140/m.4351 type:complete len:341 (-) Transcript_2140:389-1411(-)